MKSGTNPDPIGPKKNQTRILPPRIAAIHFIESPFRRIMKTLSLLLPIAMAASRASADVILDLDFEHLAPLVNDPDKLDDGDRIQDLSSNGHHGFWGGGGAANDTPVVTTTSGSTAIDNTLKAGKIFLRDGLTGIPDAWDGPTTTITPYFTFDGTQSYTFEAVVNWNSTASALNGLMGQTGGNELWIRESGGFLHYAFVSGGANANLFSNVIDITTAKADGQWHVISVVYDASAGEIRSYLDGALKHTNTDPDIGSLGTMVNGTNDFSVGGYNATASNYFNGMQDRYRISTGALAPAAFLTAPPPESGAAITWTGGTDSNWDRACGMAAAPAPTAATSATSSSQATSASTCATSSAEAMRCCTRRQPPCPVASTR